MKAVGDYIHSKGLKFGIHNCAGTLTCNGFPGGRGHEFQDARTYASWGVDFLKYDWCFNGTAKSQETYKTMSDPLSAAGRPVVFILCEWGETKPWEWAENIGHLWRTTHDIKDCYNCQNINNLGWKHLLDIQVGLEKYAGPGHWNDPDMLEVGNKGLSLAESRAHFSLWCMLAAPLMAGNDLRKMTPEILNILTNKEVIAIDQDPLGKQGYRLIKHISKEIWVKELSNGDWAICFLNTGDEPLKLSMNWDHFGILKGEYKVRNIWEKENLGTTKQLFNSEIAPHDVALLRFSKL
jgi:alpha-galactosidase